MPCKSYLITDSSYYSHDIHHFKATLKETLSSFHVDYALYRDTNFSNYAHFAKSFVNTAKESTLCKSVLHSDYKLASKLGAHGVHIPARNHEAIKRAKDMGLLVIASTHNLEEIALAREADFLTYSPIFATPNKGTPKGLENLKEILDTIAKPIFALGGIVSEEEVKQVCQAGAYGFASIRYFMKENR